MTRLALPMVAVLAAACGDRGGHAEDEHGAGSGHAEHAGEPAPGDHGDHGDHGGDHDDGPPGTVRIRAEMLRDLRITTAKAESRAAGERVTALGELAVDQDAYAEIAAPVAGRVARILASPGDVVKANQPVVELHSADLGKARAEHAAAQTRAEAARATMARKRDLAADNLVTARELADATADAAAADAEVRVTAAALAAFGGAGGTASTFLLRSPIAGTIIERSVALGQLADPSRTLFRVADLSHLWLTAHVFERDAVRVARGGTATVALAALPGQPVEATVELIGSEVEAASRTISVRLDVPNPTGALRPGMSATVALPLGDAASTVVTVPLAAVQRVGESWVVFLPQADAGAFELRAIGRGRELGGEVEVLSGLAAQTVVVVDGAFLLKAEADKARGEGGGHDHH